MPTEKLCTSGMLKYLRNEKSIDPDKKRSIRVVEVRLLAKRKKRKRSKRKKKRR